MELFKQIAQECEIENNSRVFIPDEPLRTFTRLIAHHYGGSSLSSEKEDKFAVFGYMSGLFDGSGNVDFESVKKYYDRVLQEIDTYKKDKPNLGLYDFLGVNIKYAQKKALNNKP